jgi:hypothetical protein
MLTTATSHLLLTLGHFQEIQSNLTKEDMVLNIRSLLIKTASFTEELNARPG